MFQINKGWLKNSGKMLELWSKKIRLPRIKYTNWRFDFISFNNKTCLWKVISWEGKNNCLINWVWFKKVTPKKLRIFHQREVYKDLRGIDSHREKMFQWENLTKEEKDSLPEKEGQQKLKKLKDQMKEVREDRLEIKMTEYKRFRIAILTK